MLGSASLLCRRIGAASAFPRNLPLGRKVAPTATATSILDKLSSLLSIDDSHRRCYSVAAAAAAITQPSTTAITSSNNGIGSVSNIQVRSITKRRQKREARKALRKTMEERGIPIPKPPRYIPVDTPVVNSKTREQVAQESREFDEKMSKEMSQRREELSKKQGPKALRYCMGIEDNAYELVMSDRVKKLFDLQNGNQKEVVRAQKARAMQLFQAREGDTGSSAVQVIAVTARIQQLQTHMNKHHKDNSTKRGLDRLYVRRRKLLDYMERKDFDNYRRVVKTLGLVR